jgi:2-amino-4-hydroxy-6-hydroxymethyldihydropteridine diphosphokinase
MDEVYLGIGSNIGDTLHSLVSAVRRLKGSRSIILKDVSSIYKTEPVGVKAQPDFLNAAVRIETSYGPQELLLYLKSLEGELGRRQRARWGPREIDIDILLYGDLVLNVPPLTIPHAEMNNRRFVLQPLSEIAAKAIHPGAHVTVGELLAECRDTSFIERSEELTVSFLTLVEG